jgi:hypothetical protein
MNTKSEKNQNNFLKLIPLIIQFVVLGSSITASHVSLKAKVDKNTLELRENNLYQLNSKIDVLTKSVTDLTKSFNEFTTKYWENRVSDAEKKANRNSK